MKTTMTTIVVFLLALNTMGQDPLNISDFSMLDNTRWEGQLTYKDYQTGKLTSIDATMQIDLSGKKINSKIQYIYEPNKNNTSSVKIRKNGTYYGNERIIRNSFSNGTFTFVTTYEGRDNNKKATMYITHQFNENTFIVTKEVKYQDGVNQFVRNTYNFKRIH